jgi:hypothetical protein
MHLEKLLSRNSRILPFVFCLALVSGGAFDGWSYIGGLPGAYLRSPAGAAPFAMGGAGSASADHFCTWLNPAMLARLTSTQLTIGGGLLSLGRTEGFSSLEFKITPRVGMGLMALYRGDPSLDNLYNENEDKLESGSFTTITSKIGLSYLFSKKLSAGLALTYYYERLPTSYNETSLNYSTASAIGGFDLAMRYSIRENWVCAFILQNIDVLKILSGQSASVELSWELTGETDKIPPSAVFASELKGKLCGFPLLWACDVFAYPVDGDFKKLSRMEIRLNNGIEWRRWSGFCLRAGIGDFFLNQDIVSNSSDFWENSSPRITIGFGADLQKINKRLKVNYGLATDRVWAGLDQRVDFSYSF